MPLEDVEDQIAAAGDSCEVPDSIADFVLCRTLEVNVLELRQLWREDIDALYEQWGAALGTSVGQWAHEHKQGADDGNP